MDNSEFDLVYQDLALGIFLGLDFIVMIGLFLEFMIVLMHHVRGYDLFP